MKKFLPPQKNQIAIIAVSNKEAIQSQLLMEKTIVVRMQGLENVLHVEIFKQVYGSTESASYRYRALVAMGPVLGEEQLLPSVAWEQVVAEELLGTSPQAC